MIRRSSGRVATEQIREAIQNPLVEDAASGVAAAAIAVAAANLVSVGAATAGSAVSALFA